MYDSNEKTIFVLDHTQYFGIPSEDFITLDYLKGKNNLALGTATGSKSLHHTSPGISSTSTPTSGSLRFSKSLWTCSVEASLEYCRIVWDLFPHRKLIRFILSDSAAHIINTWKIASQNMLYISNAMSMVGAPELNSLPSSENNVVHGLRAAIEALAEYTEFQREKSIQPEMPEDQQKAEQSQVKKEKNCNKLTNKGRIICITSACDDTNIKNLEEIAHNTLLEQNNSFLVGDKSNNLLIDHCHLVILNILPLNAETAVTSHGRIDISTILSTEVHIVCAKDIPSKLIHLILNHYDLASTTVTGIPMKEEQNANSSANYDVEILHVRSAHSAIFSSGNGQLSTSIKDGAEYETVTLKWCTPRGSSTADISTYPLCVAQNRVTPVDVTSRPSSCLVNFLLNGRSVLLEMPRSAKIRMKIKL